MRENAIPIIYNANDDFVVHIFLSMYSLVENACKDFYYDIYVLYTNLSTESKNLLAKMENNHCSVKFVNVSDWCNNSNLVCINWDKCGFPMEVTYRLFIPDIFPEYDKALYVDGDTIVLGDVSELYMVDLKDFYIAACSEPITRNTLKHNSIIELSNPYESLNSGVLVFNCDKFRKNNIREKCFSLLADDPEGKYIYPDQDALNVTCDGHILFLSWKWNISWAYTSVKINKKNYLSEYIVEYDERFQEALKDIGIIHYSTQVKAVDEDTFFLANYYWEYAEKTGVMDLVLEEKRKRHERVVAKMKTQYPLPIEKIDTNKKIALYGAGKIGKAYKMQIDALPNLEVAIWVDSNYLEYQEYGMAVSPVESLLNYSDAQLLISVKRPEVIIEIKEKLRSMGIPI